MSLLLAITLFEIIYLFYMFFIFETSYSFNSQFLGNKVNLPKTKENKTSVFGKFAVFFFIIFALIRLNYNHKIVSRFNLIIYLCLVPQILSERHDLNVNDLVYLIPILLLDIYITIFINKKLYVDF